MKWLLPRWRVEAYNPKTGKALHRLHREMDITFYRKKSAEDKALRLSTVAFWTGAVHRYRVVENDK